MEKEDHYVLPDYYKAFPLKAGGYSRCYYIPSRQIVYKEFNQGNYPYLRNVKRLLGMQIEGFVFPKKLVIVNNKIVGYIMDYVKGEDLDSLPESYSYNSIITNVETLEKQFPEIINYSIGLKDIYASNIMLDANTGKFVIVDTDNYTFTTTSSSAKLCNVEFCNAFSMLLNNIESDFLPFESDGINIKTLQTRALDKGQIKPSLYLNIMKEYYEHYSGIDIETITDYNDAIELSQMQKQLYKQRKRTRK